MAALSVREERSVRNSLMDSKSEFRGRPRACCISVLQLLAVQ
jgi:hypothetical protein